MNEKLTRNQPDQGKTREPHLQQFDLITLNWHEKERQIIERIAERFLEIFIDDSHPMSVAKIMDNFRQNGIGYEEVFEYREQPGVDLHSEEATASVEQMTMQALSQSYVYALRLYGGTETQYSLARLNPINIYKAWLDLKVNGQNTKWGLREIWDDAAIEVDPETVDIETQLRILREAFELVFDDAVFDRHGNLVVLEDDKPDIRSH